MESARKGIGVRLLGSRLDDAARGGGIDLLIELERPDPEQRRKALTPVALLQQCMGEQPIDVLVWDPESPLRPVHRQALDR